MRKQISKKLKIIFLLILIIAIFFISSIILFLINPDITNVEVKGYVNDENGAPVENSTVVIFNSTYKAKDSNCTDYSSYLGHDTLVTKTNKNGYYIQKIDKSAFVTIRVYKQGFLISKSEGINSSSNIKYDFVLFRGVSKETDLYEKQQIIEKIK